MPAMGHTIQDGVNWLQKRIPMHTAASWDNTGLLLGDPHAPLRRIATCLTVTPQTSFDAIQMGADLLISHHPIFFKGPKSLVSSRPKDKMILDLIRANVAVFSPHTAWDNAKGGINEQLIHLAGASQVTALRPTLSKNKHFKIVVFVPPEARKKVSEALFGAGAGIIGNYSGCSFRLTGTGTFFGNEYANPVVGQKGRVEEVPEERLEVICSRNGLVEAIQALRQNHPYEEPAFDIYPLEPEPSPIVGEGRIGNRTDPIGLADLSSQMAKALRVPFVQMVGNPDKTGNRVAVACGAAGEFLSDAISAGADFFVTGELRYHDGLEAESAGIGVIVLGHHASEHFAMEALGKEMATALPGLTSNACPTETDPFASVSAN